MPPYFRKEGIHKGKYQSNFHDQAMNWFFWVWLQTAKSRQSKRSAFLKAPKELKVKYPNPYYWGAFVMVGE